MKRLLAITIASLLASTSSTALAQKAERNEDGRTIYAAEEDVGPIFSVNRYGHMLCSSTDGGSGLTQSVVPVSNATSLNGLGSVPIGFISAATDSAEAGSTATVINATSHSARVGDVIQPYSGTAGNVNAWSYVTAVTANTITVGKAFPAVVAASDNFYIWRPTIIQATNPATSAGGALAVAVDRQNQISVAGGLLKAEDAAHSSGDAGVQALGIQNTSFATLSQDGDYSPIAMGRAGQVYNTQVFDDNLAYSRQVPKLEDSAHTNGDVGVPIFQRLLGAGQAGSSGGTANDYVTLDGDIAGRLMINPWGQNTDNFGSTCGTATATTSDVAIASAVASNRIYVSGVTCASSDADNATNINFKDGSTVVAVGGVNQMATTSAGTFTAVFNPPLRGTVNTAFNFNTAVSTSSVICCATYFTSTL